MSLLLDALKKAALEKQRREKPGYELQKISAVVEPPVVAAVADDENENAGLTFDFDDINSGYPEENLAVTLNTMDEPITEAIGLAAVPEMAVPEIAVPEMAVPEIAVPEIAVPEMVEISPQETVLQQTVLQQTVLQQAALQEAVIQEAVLPEKVVPQAIAPETVPLKQETIPLNIITLIAPTAVAPEATPVAAPSEPIKDTTPFSAINEAAIAPFNLAAGKNALVELLDRSKKAADFARKRILIMYGLLTLTALCVLIFYYYLLQNNSSSILPMPSHSMAAAPELAPENVVSAVDSAVAQAAVNSEPVNSESINSEPVNSEAVNSEPVNSEAINPEAVNSEPVNSEAINSEAVNPKTVNPVKRTAAEPSSNRDLTVKPTLPGYKTQKSPSRPVAKASKARPSEVLPPEFVAKQAIIAYKNSPEDSVSDAIARGYKAYQQGDFTTAGAAYREALAEDPNQRDALLGAAAVAVREARQQDALTFYQQRLARDPKDEYAQAGILALSSSAAPNPPLDSELARLLREYPKAAHLYQLQGSLYAARQQWEAAQSAFFEAWQRDAKNPDIAFNLGVALDHLNQPKEAIRFYQAALRLSAESSGNLAQAGVVQASFVPATLERRLKELMGDASHEINQEGNTR